MKKLYFILLTVGMLAIGYNAEASPSAFVTTSSSGVLVATPNIVVTGVSTSSGAASTRVILISTTGVVGTTVATSFNITNYDDSNYIAPPMLLSSATSVTGQAVISSLQTLPIPEGGIQVRDGLVLIQTTAGGYVTIYFKTVGYERGAKWISEEEAMDELEASMAQRGLRLHRIASSKKSREE